jgi:lysyl-tRNA synthetase class 2
MEDLNILEVRQAKLAAIRAKNTVAFPNTFKRDSYANDLQVEFKDKNKEELATINKTVIVAGRVMLNRGAFLVLQDSSGRIQIYINKKELTDEVKSEIESLDLGDIIWVKGELSRSGKGDLYVHLREFHLLVKSLQPLPDKHHGLTDTEMRYRRRYLDLIVNDEARQIFATRSKVVSFIRQFLTDKGFMEVETPMLQTLAGGAAAKPFETYHNALDLPMFLRIAPELFLKRLVVGGFEKVFEINRNFRNEGVSTRHNPEFTMLEWYMAYATYEDNMNLTEEMFAKLAEHVLGKTQFDYQGTTFDFGKPFERLTMFDSILKYNPHLTAADLNNFELLKDIVNNKLKVATTDNDGLGKLQTILFEETVEAKLIQPTFITQYPFEVSPLARKNDKNPQVTDRFELFIGGRELANAYSELNDAQDQAARFNEQVKAKDAGDFEAMHYDADFVMALEYGMPPTSGEGIGIDRLVMLLTNSASIRDVILFPHMRPE